jgi:23S rRNA pseudouridine2605 synthase
MDNQSLTSLSKYLATAGVAARRKVVFLIKDGLVTVNNHVITEPEFRVKPTDVIVCDGKTIRQTKKVYILLNKPKNYITSAEDEEGRATVFELIHQRNLPRLFSVGRLDRNTTGLLLLTNDGALTQALSHPRNRINKAYRVTLEQPLEAIDFDKIKLGIYLSDGKIRPDKVYIVPGSNKHDIVIELHSGKNRIVRRIFASLNYNIRALDRFKFAGLTKQGLARGAWRFLKQAEIERLFQLIQSPHAAHIKKVIK